LLYNSNVILACFTLRGIFVEGAGGSRQQPQMQPPTLYKPIIIDVALFVKHKEVPTLNGMTIVPWKPTASALAL
jgi:hypothetical protein